MANQILLSIKIILEFIALGAGFSISIMVLRRNKSETLNRLISLAAALFGIYILANLIYDLIPEIAVIEVFLRISLIAALFSIIFWYFSIECILNSITWLKKWQNTSIYLGLAIIYSIWICFIDFIHGFDPQGIRVNIDYLPLIILSLALFFFTIRSTWILNKYGIKKSKDSAKKHMLIIFYGFILQLIAIIINIFANIVTEGTIFLIAFYALNTVGIILIGIGFMQKN